MLLRCFEHVIQFGWIPEDRYGQPDITQSIEQMLL